MTNTIEIVDWDFLADTIEDEKCVLFLGPGIAVNEAGKSLQSAFFEELYQQNQTAILSYHKQDGFLLFNDQSTKMRLIYRIKKFYKEIFAQELLEKIIKIPFHLIVSVTPDLSLQKIAEQNNIPADFFFYDRRTRQDLKVKPSASKPLIYNMFGSITNDETLIVTHNDLFEYLKAVFGEIKLPDELRMNIAQAKQFIFLGFEFDKWYFLLLLSLLNLNDERFVRYASTQELNNEVKALCEKHFRINFVSKNINNFVNKIYDMFQAKDGLRKPAGMPVSRGNYILSNIRELLNEMFNSESLTVFCQDYYWDIYNQFSDEMTKTKKIALLIDYVKRNNTIKELLNRLKEIDEDCFFLHQPYFE